MTQPIEIHTLAGAYALHALDDIERAAFARHIASCAACAAEVAELTQAAARLGGVVWQAPPASMRTAVLREVAGTRQVTASGPGQATPGGEVAVRRWRRWTAAAVAAGVVAVGGVATTIVIEERRVDQIAAERARLIAVLSAGDAQVRTTRVTGGGTVTVAVSASLDRGVVLLSGLPRQPDGKAYQLWLISGTAPTSAGVLAVGQRGGTVLLEQVSAADTLGVTVEPAGGSRLPTLPVFAAVALS